MAKKELKAASLHGKGQEENLWIKRSMVVDIR